MVSKLWHTLGLTFLGISFARSSWLPPYRENSDECNVSNTFNCFTIFYLSLCCPLCSKAISSYKKMNSPSLKSALRTATAYNKLHLDEPRKSTCHTHRGRQKKEGTSKTSSSFIPHLTGLKMESKNPIYLDELIICIA